MNTGHFIHTNICVAQQTIVKNHIIIINVHIKLNIDIMWPVWAAQSLSEGRRPGPLLVHWSTFYKPAVHVVPADILPPACLPPAASSPAGLYDTGLTGRDTVTSPGSLFVSVLIKNYADCCVVTFSGLISLVVRSYQPDVGTQRLMNCVSLCSTVTGALCNECQFLFISVVFLIM